MTNAEQKLDLTGALDAVRVPGYAVDREGRVLWVNRRAVELFDVRVGDRFARVVAPEDLHVARTHLAKKLLGEAASTEFEVTLVDRERNRLRARVSSVPLVENGQIVGAFGLAYPETRREAGGRRPRADAPELTARQRQALLLLAEGLGTDEIALRLGVAEETARNHIRGVLRQLDVHSRLEAVVRAYELGLLQPRR